MTQHAGNRSWRAHLCALALLVILFGLVTVSCSMPGVSGQSVPTTRAASHASTASTQGAGPLSATPDLHGPANFLFVSPLNFSNVGGAATDPQGTVTPLSAQLIENDTSGELKHLLFVVDNNDQVVVYGPGVTPVKAQVIMEADGSTAIDYTQTVNSEAGTISILFVGSLLKDRMAVTYRQQYTPSMLINATASDIVVTFTARIKWVTPSQIPASPSNGTYRLTEDGGIALNWAAAPNAVAYDVYRLISDHDQQFQLLVTVTSSSYLDETPEARQNVHSMKGITYTIFSVGPDGVENPGGLVISIASS